MPQASQYLPTLVDLSPYGITNVQDVVYNPSFDQLFEEETREGLEGYARGIVTDSGAIAVDTGKFTGRSPKDKYIVKMIRHGTPCGGLIRELMTIKA